MSSYTQAKRSLSLTTPLGADVLLLNAFTGRESLSRLYSFQLEMASEKDVIDPNAIVGMPVGWSVAHIDQEPRYFHGIVNRFVAGGRSLQNLRLYRAEVVPWFWFLTRSADCRIYQGKKTPDIIEDVFNRLGFSGPTYFESKLKGSYNAWEYCVQYRETAFNFVSRLMEHEGIFYYFRHEKDKHVLVLADASSAYTTCGESKVEYSPGEGAGPNSVNVWEHQYEYRSGLWSRTDYNFETPSTSLMTSNPTKLTLKGMSKFELYDYPGEYQVKGAGDAITKIRMEEEEAPYNVVSGASECCTFTPGGKFSLVEHEVAAEKGGYVVTAIQHHASDTSYGSSTDEAEYSNTFTCIPDSVAYRPPRVTPKPFVQGPQTAVVTGPSGEEIYVDKYARVKVQFFWDRVGKKNESSSCWIRVAENWAGKNWGLVSHPRIGQEVVVDFLEGDPDRPLITGRVYNAEQMPPYDLPANATQSGIKSRSSKGGSPANFNEIRFEDKKGSEQVFIHAEKDQTIEVEHDESHWVGHDRTKNIDHDETTHVKHDRTETVDNNETITIHGNRTETVDKDEKITINGNRTETVQKNENITINGGRTETVAKDENITINGGRTETVAKDENITINGGRTETVAKDENITINGGRTESVAKDEGVTISGGRSVNITNADSLTVGKTLSITATDSITLTTGQASITMQKDGTITIQGKDITIQGSGEIVGKADKNMTLKGQKILQN